MITFLSSPKPFRGVDKDNQYRAIRSWLAASGDAEVILYGDSPGIDEAGDALGVRVQKQIGSATSGIPYFGAIVEHAAECGKHDLQVYLNCDILLNGFPAAMARIQFDQFLLIGQRIDLGEDVFVDVAQGDWLERLKTLVADGKAELHSPTGMDYFGFRRGMWKDLPSIIIGRGGYDNALIAYCMRNRTPVVDGSFAVAALHQFHEYQHMQGGERAVMRGPEAMQNIVQAGGAWGATMASDCEYVVKDTGIERRPCRGDRLRSLELNVRYATGWPSVAKLLRLVWRGLNAVGVTRVPQLALADMLDAYGRLQTSCSQPHKT
jgi:hypothetical protein